MIKEDKFNNITYITGNPEFESEKITIIFIHGSGCSKIMWEKQVETLSKYANTIAIDLPCHGKSQDQDENNISGYVKSIIDFLPFIKSKKIIVCGLSLGGAIVLQLLIEHGENFSAGILINSGAKLKVLPQIFDAIKNDYNGYIKMIAAVAASKKTDVNLITPLLNDMLNCPVQIVINDFKACDEFDVREKLNLIKVPVLILTAEEDHLTPTKYGDFLEKNIKNSHRFHIMDAGHFSPLEKSDEVSQIIQSFLSNNNNFL